MTSVHPTAVETLEVVDRGWWTAPSGQRVDGSAAIAQARDGTRTYDPEALAALVARPPPPPRPTTFEVTPEGTTQAARRLSGEGRLCVLNFASARNVGGGFLGGARAQEEDLCRASALYRCLETQPGYYAANRAERSTLYTDHLIWSPDVPFFRDEQLAWVEAPFSASVLTSPAPNTRALAEPDLPLLAATFTRRAATVLAVAEAHAQDTVVLGAWGCGAFGGDPEVAAHAFHHALTGRFAGSFARVVFAVLARNARDRRNLEVFTRWFP